ncbi:hypothetical protein [Pseudomonas citronellolis]|uniref:hypothetical protein n=1 Tax=Pseudomonas citronellolis TaxID=53408 RepID=UPI0007186A10|nr:hypothetical protein [Pseudomonas citronellolis]KRV72594.1 hypothetical protein AO742_18325 [Pseudomonas citronellolis]KRW77683.1 hypothetical protein AO738_03905 [Pseudomonas citronellolis]
MAATELQKIQALYRRSSSTSVAGVNLAGDVDTILQFDKLSAEEMRKALRDALDRYEAHREQACDEYHQRGVELGELLP